MSGCGMHLPAPLVFTIWQFAGPKALYLNKEVVAYAETYKQSFITDPLILHYQLQRLKEKVSMGRARTYTQGMHPAGRCMRASIYVEKPRNIPLSGNLPLGKVQSGGTIKCHKALTDKLIPASYMKYCGAIGDNYRVTYWEIERTWVTDIKRAKLYTVLFGPV